MSTIVLALFIYMTLGTFISRGMNARQRAAALSTSPGRMGVPYAMVRKNHSDNCYRNPRYRHPGPTCDCHLHGQWRELGGKAMEGKVVELDEDDAGSSRITNPYVTMAFWPVMGYHSFLTSGTYKVKGEYKEDKELKARIEALELENGIGVDDK